MRNHKVTTRPAVPRGRSVLARLEAAFTFLSSSGLIAYAVFMTALTVSVIA